MLWDRELSMCHWTVKSVFFLNICPVVSCRTSILSEVSTRSSSKLPSGKNILIFGKCYLTCMCESLCFCSVWVVFVVPNPEANGQTAKADDWKLKLPWFFKQHFRCCFFPHSWKEDIISTKFREVILGGGVLIWVGPPKMWEILPLTKKICVKHCRLWQSWEHEHSHCIWGGKIVQSRYIFVQAVSCSNVILLHHTHYYSEITIISFNNNAAAIIMNNVM